MTAEGHLAATGPAGLAVGLATLSDIPSDSPTVTVGAQPQWVHPRANSGETTIRLVSSFFQDLFIDSPFRLGVDSRRSVPDHEVVRV